MTVQKRFPYPGAIDADGHILEPPDLWEKYIDPPYRDLAIRIRPNADGLEVWEIAGRPSKFFKPGQLVQFGAMGKDEAELTPRPDRTYLNSTPFGAMDPKERVALLDQEGLEKAVLYPSLGLAWESEEVEDIGLQAAYARAYNRWIVDFCSDSGGRLVPIAHITMGDPQEAVRELVDPMSAATRQKVLGENVAQVYGL